MPRRRKQLGRSVGGLCGLPGTELLLEVRCGPTRGSRRVCAPQHLDAPPLPAPSEPPHAPPHPSSAVSTRLCHLLRPLSLSLLPFLWWSWWQLQRVLRGIHVLLPYQDVLPLPAPLPVSSSYCCCPCRCFPWCYPHCCPCPCSCCCCLSCPRCCCCCCCCRCCCPQDPLPGRQS